MERVKSTNGKHDKVLLDGYAYNYFRSTKDGDIQTYRCDRYNELRCEAKLRVTASTSSCTLVGIHIDAPDPGHCEIIKVSANMKSIALLGSEPPRRIYADNVAGISSDAAVVLPQYESSQRMMQRARQRVRAPHPVPTNFQELDIPVELQSTQNSEPFILFDSGRTDANRIILFGTSDNVKFLQDNKNWFADGTFKITPNLFYQVYTLHAIKCYTVVPLIYALLPDKREETYRRVLDALLDVNNNLYPESCMLDLEKAAENAFMASFPGISITLCLFHLGQCLWRKIQELQLANLYRDDQDIRRQCKWLLALAFVPPSDVVATFVDCKARVRTELSDLYDYWESTYIGAPRRGRRQVPLYKIDNWNQTIRLADDLPRTNNAVEGWHHAFQSMIGSHHPQIFTFIGHILKEQGITDVVKSRLRSGVVKPVSSKSRYVRCGLRIKSLVQQYPTIQRIEYLDGIQHNLTITM